MGQHRSLRCICQGVAIAVLAAAPAHAATLRVGGAGYPTLAAAVAAVPAVRAALKPGEGIEIVLPAGTMRLAAAVTIDAVHGGMPGAPLVIRGAGAARTRLVGSVPVATRALVPGDTGGRPAPASARAIDLGALPGGGLLRRGMYVKAPVAGIELFQGAARLAPSRWPATGYVTATATGSNAQGPVVSVPGSRAAVWRDEPALWAGGYWGADWSYELAPVAAIVPRDATIRLAPLRGEMPLRTHVRFAVENALSELRRPGTFVVDPARHVAIVLPAGTAPFEAAVAPGLLVIDGAHDVTIDGIAFDRTLGPAVEVRGGRAIRFADCAFRQTGGNGATVTGGAGVVFIRTVIASTAEIGVRLTGGDRASLTPGGHAFVDGIVADFGLESPTYRPAVQLEGVGNQLRGSLLRGGDHNAVMVSGNDHVVAGNEIADVLRDTEDAGAIYMGADWSQRGIGIVGNYIHDLGGARPTLFLSGIYLDDQFSGAHVAGNVLVGGDFGVVIGGGRDDRVEGNLIVDPRRGGIHFDQRGMDTQRARIPEFAARMARMPVRSAAWLARYPALRALTPARFGVPDGDVVTTNTVFGAPAILADPAASAARLSASRNRGSLLRVSTDPAALAALAAHMPGVPPLANRAAALAALLPLLAVPAR